MTDANKEQQASSPAQKLRGLDKVTALLLAMERPVASRVLKHFDDEEIRLVASSASKLGVVPRNILDEVIKEFVSKIVTEGGIQGSANDAEELLLGILPGEQVRQIMSDIRAQVNEAVWPRLTQFPPDLMAQYLAKEHPQVAAFFLSKTPASAAAGIMAQLPPGSRDELMRRLLSMKVVMEPSLRFLEGTLRDELLQKISRSTGANIHSKIADIINKMERQEMEQVLESLSQYKPREAKIVRSLLFTFEDIAKLTDASRLILFADIEPEALISALTGAQPDLRDLILNAVPSRTRRLIEQELASGMIQTQKEIQSARRTIADLALDMAERGIIELKPESEQ